SLGGSRYKQKQVVKTKTVFDLPLRIKEPAKIFTSSLTDLFHPDIDSYRNEVWDIIRRCPHHTFQILTKRPERIKDHLPGGWGQGWHNVWLGTSIGSNKSIHRLSQLSLVNAKTKFLSLEPLHGPIDLRSAKVKIMDMDFFALSAIDWVIIGGESGNEKGQYRYRKCKIEWIETLIHQCTISHIPVFVKQLGTYLAKELRLKDRHGRDIDEWPEHLRIREFPILGKEKQGNIQSSNQTSKKENKDELHLRTPRTVYSPPFK